MTTRCSAQNGLNWYHGTPCRAYAARPPGTDRQHGENWAKRSASLVVRQGNLGKFGSQCRPPCCLKMGKIGMPQKNSQGEAKKQRSIGQNNDLSTAPAQPVNLAYQITPCCRGLVGPKALLAQRKPRGANKLTHVATGRASRHQKSP